MKEQEGNARHATRRRWSESKVLQAAAPLARGKRQWAMAGSCCRQGRQAKLPIHQFPTSRPELLSSDQLNSNPDLQSAMPSDCYRCCARALCKQCPGPVSANHDRQASLSLVAGPRTPIAGAQTRSKREESSASTGSQPRSCSQIKLHKFIQLCSSTKSGAVESFREYRA